MSALITAYRRSRPGARLRRTPSSSRAALLLPDMPAGACREPVVNGWPHVVIEGTVTAAKRRVHVQVWDGDCATGVAHQTVTTATGAPWSELLRDYGPADVSAETHNLCVRFDYMLDWAFDIDADLDAVRDDGIAAIPADARIWRVHLPAVYQRPEACAA
jgi:hypothetical protein